MFSSTKFFKDSITILEHPTDWSADGQQPNAHFRIKVRIHGEGMPTFTYQRKQNEVGDWTSYVISGTSVTSTVIEPGCKDYTGTLYTGGTYYDGILNERWRVIVTCPGKQTAVSNTVKWTFSGEGRGPNNANIGNPLIPEQNATWNNTVGNLTTVGTNGGSSFYGTFDQGGQVYEWNDEVATFNSEKLRCIRGGHCVGVGVGQRAGCHINDRAFGKPWAGPGSINIKSDVMGFRLSSILDPLNYSSGGNVFLTVGDPENEAYQNFTVNNINDPFFPNGLIIYIGKVDYIYKIMKYPVTNAEYVQFLNAVDPSGSNQKSLYDYQMSDSPRGGISLNPSGATGSKYFTKQNMGNKPVNFVDWFCAARFANWLHNKTSDPTVSGNQATENGAYALNNDVSVDILNPPQANANAKYRVPSEHEWLKAGYYKGSYIAGPGDRNPWWNYPTRNSFGPNHVKANSVGDGILTIG